MNLLHGAAKLSPMAQELITWNPINNKKYETLSYLPALSDDSIAREIDYMIKKEWIPCLEFDEVGHVHRENSRMPGYYDGRYWTMWKLPMFGCNDSSQVLNEIHECKKAYPNAYIRCLAFDNKHQGQCMSFIIQKPNTTATSTPPPKPFNIWVSVGETSLCCTVMSFICFLLCYAPKMDGLLLGLLVETCY
ncbi:hypothetical protein GH714_002742 [Hevea brasiliensis]|uniref:Ribulose bisphosphate carboxylase small subunit, chloroplastic n=1 Tax=Hevea brasiliensis TaxID=3981 RepID=A0A6A6MBX6_HEVBR|nr:hypothetical protein GH714_002742 [Hevea brasiliensis]